MRILFVSTHTSLLDIPVNGDAQRTRFLYEACKRFADVDLITIEGHPKELQYPGKLKKWCALLPFSGVTSLFPYSPANEAVLDEKIRKGNYDYIVSRYFFRAVSCGLWKYHEKLIVDFDDALPFYFINQISPDSALSSRIRLQLSARRAKTISKRAIREMHASFFAEKSVAITNGGAFLPNIPFYSDSCLDADMGGVIKRIVFVGQLEYQPNREGLDHFFDNIYLPLIERLPNIEMHVVGLVKNESLRNRWLSYPNVTLTGFVDDLKKEYADSQVVVVPVYRCGATNIKLLEAMAMNRACVTTKEAFAKMNGCFENGRDLYAAAGDEEYIEMLEKLLTDEYENHRVAQNGKSVMDRYYSFDAFCDIVKSAIV